MQDRCEIRQESFYITMYTFDMIYLLFFAAATPWKMPLKQKKEPPCKKRKDEPPPGS